MSKEVVIEVNVPLCERNKTIIAQDIKAVLSVFNGLIREAKEHGLVVKIHSNEYVLGQTDTPFEIEVYEKVMC